MSFIDARLGSELRETYLQEIRAWLPSFLSSSSIERLNPLDQIQDLLNLDPAQLRRTVAVHVVLQQEIQDLLGALPAGMRSPATSSSRPRQLSRVVAGGIDWPATLRSRATGPVLEFGFVTRPARRIFDVPENKVLAWTLSQLDHLASLSAQIVRSESRAGWQLRLHRAFQATTNARRTTWIRSIDATRPTPPDFAALAVNRKRFYRVSVAQAASTLRRYSEDPTPEDITELLIQRWFEPERDWQLFELTVLLRLERQFSLMFQRDRLRSLVGLRGPFATYKTTDGGRLRIWYQNWPPSASPSELQDATAHYGIYGSASRPDIVIEIVSQKLTAGILLELKATRSSEYLAAGLLQLLGYMRDRPSLFNREQCGWLVAPSDAPLKTVSPEGRHLWAVNADYVAGAAAQYVQSLLAGTN